ncbi:hypothetical protein SUGI_0105560 [Cryptomeria japonica]|uniref:F-box/kelch-repeat protein At1g55270-like n=1 Tax=Cryptomeria japonica TaxID=3369 RepID=UPI002408C771|nr:F-box/kelch-repeat protein At1g55270-like [Cryptomeria japonica]GLJ09282.1 hypothetical protein SUGI_0105560 [Cryptomeria japonica]
MNIIPGLLEDLGLQCLVKVPYKFHNHLRAVCKRWNAILSSPNLYKERERHNECEEGIAYFHRLGRPTGWEVIIYYPHGKWWEILPRIPQEFILNWKLFHDECNFLYVRSKYHLVAMGLLSKGDRRPTVLMFDFLSRTWRRGLDMPFRLWNHGCAVSPSPQGLIYIATLRYNNNGIIPDVLQPYVFNVEENKWDFLPPMNPDWHDNNCFGEFVDDKFYLLPTRRRSVHIYDPHSQLWKTINTHNNSSALAEELVSAFGRLYCFGREQTVREFDYANNSFTTVGQYPAQIYVIQRAVLCRDYIFVSAMEVVNCEDVYYRFNPLEREEEKRWTQIEMPAEFPGAILSLATTVQI